MLCYGGISCCVCCCFGFPHTYVAVHPGKHGGGLTGARGFGLTGFLVSQNPAPHLPSRRLIQKRARANLARAGARERSKQRACYEIQLQNPHGTWLQLHSCRSLHKHARANLARGRSFSSVGARSGLGLTGARERSKSLKIVRLPRNLAPGRTWLPCGREGEGGRGGGW